MSNLSPVLYGNRLYGQETYSENADPLTTSFSFSESVSSADAIADNVTKPLADAMSLLDAYIATLTLVQTDAVTLADARALTATRPLSDSLSPSDSAIVNFTKALTDSVSASDSKDISATKALSDSMTLAEAFMVSFGHAFSETLSLSDSKAITTVKPLGERSTAESTLYGRKLFGRANYSSGMNMDNPSLTLVDMVTRMITKALSDSVTMTDARAATVTKSLIDSILAVDPRIVVSTSKHLSDILLVQDWISVRLIKPGLWTANVPVVPSSTLYGRNMYGRPLYSGIGNPFPWNTQQPVQPNNGWKSFNQLEPQN